MTRITLRFACMATFLAVLVWEGSAYGQTGALRVRLSFAGTIDCDQPRQVRGLRISGEGTATLFPDRRASLDMSIRALNTNRLRFDATLGGQPVAAPGGTASLRVMSANQLRMSWDLPNNSLIVNLRAVPGSCTLSIEHRLRGGALKYSMFDGGAFYFCSRPNITTRTCAAAQ